MWTYQIRINTSQSTALRVAWVYVTVKSKSWQISPPTLQPEISHWVMLQKMSNIFNCYTRRSLEPTYALIARKGSSIRSPELLSFDRITKHITGLDKITYSILLSDILMGAINTLRLTENGRRFADSCIFLHQKCCILIKMWLICT